jgi:hypothetical protein
VSAPSRPGIDPVRPASSPDLARGQGWADTQVKPSEVSGCYRRRARDGPLASAVPARLAGRISTQNARLQRCSDIPCPGCSRRQPSPGRRARSVPRPCWPPPPRPPWRSPPCPARLALVRPEGPAAARVYQCRTRARGSLLPRLVRPRAAGCLAGPDLRPGLLRDQALAAGRPLVGQAVGSAGQDRPGPVGRFVYGPERQARRGRGVEGPR